MKIKIHEFLKKLVQKKPDHGLSDISSEKLEMIQAILGLSEISAREIMVPRIDVVALRVDSSISESLEAVTRSGHSRFPVYGETVDKVVGILHAKDLLKALQNNKAEISLVALVKPAYFVPETIRIDSLLREMKKRRTHIAIVVDEYGGVSGIVSMEDIIEEILGDIQDEFDNEKEDIIKLSDGVYLCDARTNLGDINDELKLSLPDENFDTLGGLVFDHFGKIPVRFEKIRIGACDFIIQDVDGNKIKTVKIVMEVSDDNREHE